MDGITFPLVCQILFPVYPQPYMLNGAWHWADIKLPYGLDSFLTLPPFERGEVYEISRYENPWILTQVLVEKVSDAKIIVRDTVDVVDFPVDGRRGIRLKGSSKGKLKSSDMEFVEKQVADLWESSQGVDVPFDDDPFVWNVFFIESLDHEK